MTKPSYSHSFTLNEQEEIDFQTARTKYTQKAIILLGIKEALKDCPEVPKGLNEKILKEIKGI